MTLKFGWYGDDFTGATDTLAMAARGNLRTILFLDVPEPRQLERIGPLDAIGIAGTARSMNPSQMRASLPKVGRFFQELAVPILHYKCCSTFDSSPQSGSLGVAIKILGRYVGSTFAIIVGGQPDIGRYCCFGNLFATAGSSGNTFRIDRHPTMQCHPVTPMSEADLRLHLKLQGMSEVMNVPFAAYEKSDAELNNHVDHAASRSVSTNSEMDTGVLFDVACHTHLHPVGRQIQRISQQFNTALVVGSSVVLQAVLASQEVGHESEVRQHSHSANSAERPPVSGATFVFAASLSPVTAAQVMAGNNYKKIPLQARQLLSDAEYRKKQRQHICDLLGRNCSVLAYIDQQNGRDSHIDTTQFATCTAQFIHSVVQTLSEHGARLSRLGIAGGDTSSQAMSTLDVWALSYSRMLSPGVTVCTMHSDTPVLDGVEVMLKGGQMGSDDVFDRFLSKGMPEMS